MGVERVRARRYQIKISESNHFPNFGGEKELRQGFNPTSRVSSHVRREGYLEFPYGTNQAVTAAEIRELKNTE